MHLLILSVPSFAVFFKKNPAQSTNVLRGKRREANIQCLKQKLDTLHSIIRFVRKTFALLSVWFITESMVYFIF